MIIASAPSFRFDKCQIIEKVLGFKDLYMMVVLNELKHTALNRYMVQVFHTTLPLVIT